MTIVRAPEIEEQVARAGGDGKRTCQRCKKPNRALCWHGTMEYEDGSERRCPNLTGEEDDL